MNTLKPYNEFVNEGFLGLDKLADKIKNYLNKKEKPTKTELKDELTEILLKYKTELLASTDKIKRSDINKIITDLTDELGENIVLDFNLDSFFRGLHNVLSVKKKDKATLIEKYFQLYLNNLPKRIETLHGELDKPKDYSDDEEFEELKKLKRNVILKIPKKKFKSAKIPLQIELLKMQEWMKKNDYKLLVICDGRDASGKGSAIKTITEFLQPKYFDVETFDIPTEDQKKNWFSRYLEVMPKPGHIVFFDRSWYNRAVNDPVMGYCSHEEYEKFMDDVVPFEERLNKKGIHIIKLWFSVTKETQELRFKLRQANPLKYWKFSENDLKTMSKWEQFTAYKERMFNETSTPENPWIVVDSDDKRLAQLNVMRYILNQVNYKGKDMEVIGQPYPEIIIPMI
jgi:polyphosphate kinase 2